jgi:LCP family protein required for cell wall assembly
MGIVVALLLAAGGYAYYIYVHPATAIPVLNHRKHGLFKNRFTVLLLGEGLIQSGNRDVTNPKAPDQTDTMMLLSIDPSTDQASVLSVPRDTKINLPQAGGLAKINDANFVGGPKLAAKEVAKLLHVPVDYYIETTMYNFPAIVNLLGGLTVDVPYPMRYGTAVGAGAKYNIDLNPGVHHLDGLEVLQMARFRNTPLGDIGRIQNDQYILRLIVQKALSPSELPHLPEIIALLRGDITHTNPSPT